MVYNEDASNHIIAQSSGSTAGDDNACEGFERKRETINAENDNSQSDHTSGSNQSNAARNVAGDWSSHASEDDTGNLIGSKHKRLVVRPAFINQPDQFVTMETGEMHPLQMNHWMLIFSFLSSVDLCRCLCVCKTWDQWCIDRRLWSDIDLQRQRIKQTHLRGIVRRQPESLTFAGAVMTHKQLEWLVARLPQLKSLNLSNCAWATISGLCSASCPLLESLNLSWATNVRDECFAYLIQPPSDRKPAMRIISRLHRLQTLIVSGTEITEASLGLIGQHCPSLTTLDISFCMHVKNQGVAVLCQRREFQETISSVNMSGCCHLTSECLDSMKMCSHLKFVSLKNCQNIALSACQKFASEYNHHSFTVKDNKTIFLDDG